MTPEQQALRSYIEDNNLRLYEIAEVTGYSRGAVSSWLGGKTAVPRFVLLGIGFYPPAYQQEADTANKFRFEIARIIARNQQQDEDKALRKLNGNGYCAYASNAEKTKAMRLMRRWCEMHGFVGVRGGCDIDRAAAYLNRSYSTVSGYVYGELRPSKEIVAQIISELEESKK